MNQCDGCRRGLPKDENGLHYNPDGSYDMICCTKELYEKEWDAKASPLNTLLCAIIYLSGTVDQLYKICVDLIDDKDRRILNARDGLKLVKSELDKIQ